MSEKRTTTSRRRRADHKGRLTSPVCHKSPGLIVRILRFMPGWAWWIGVLTVVSIYAFFLYFFFLSPNGFRWRALFGRVVYPSGYNIHGIDISHYQGDINWELLRNQGTIDDCPIRFVMIKATEGATMLDDKFEDNFFKAREYGFTRGAYHFFSTQSSAADQARFFISKVNLEKGDLPPVLDVEQKPSRQSKESFCESVLEWLRIVEENYGVKPILYTYFKFKTEYLSDTIFNQYPYWIAHYYVDSLDYQGEWKFWQHTDEGTLPGIKGNVDLNVYNGSFYDLRKLTIGSQETIGIDAYRDP